MQCIKNTSMKVVTLCGSMRFIKQMQKIALELEVKKGYCVLAPICVETAQLTSSEKEILSEAHLRKIDISDAIYVVNIGGYIGESVLKEIGYAKKLNKQILYHEKNYFE